MPTWCDCAARVRVDRHTGVVKVEGAALCGLSLFQHVQRCTANRRAGAPLATWFPGAWPVLTTFLELP